jgi:hypothetical protein
MEQHAHTRCSNADRDAAMLTFMQLLGADEAVEHHGSHRGVVTGNRGSPSTYETAVGVTV